MTPEERAAPLELAARRWRRSPAARVNFGDDVFENSFPIMRGILAEMKRIRRASRSWRSSTRAISPTRAGWRGRAAHVPAARRFRARRAGRPGSYGPEPLLPGRRRCPPAARGRWPVSAASNCRWRWPRSRWAATCGSGWRTTSIYERGPPRAQRRARRSHRPHRRGTGPARRDARPGAQGFWASRARHLCHRERAAARNGPHPGPEGAHCSLTSSAGRCSRSRCCC